MHSCSHFCLLTLQARGDMVVFDEGMGNAVFVSHEWVAKQHPDPEFKQMKVLQDVLRRLLTTSGSVPSDVITESFVGSAQSISFEHFQSRPYSCGTTIFPFPSCTKREVEGRRTRRRRLAAFQATWSSAASSLLFAPQSTALLKERC